MNPTKQNIAIAELCGWTECAESTAPIEFRRGSHGMKRDALGNRTAINTLPSYTTDLNAMHKAEKVLTDDEWETYADYLLFPNGDEAHSNYTSLRRGCMATAAQRAEAFLRVQGKWEDDK